MSLRETVAPIGPLDDLEQWGHPWHGLVKGGTLICSGILNERAEEVRVALEKSGFTILSHEKSDDWSAFAAKK